MAAIPAYSIEFDAGFSIQPRDSKSDPESCIPGCFGVDTPFVLVGHDPPVATRNRRPFVDTSENQHEDNTPSIAYKPRRRTGKQAAKAGRTSKSAPSKRPIKLMVDQATYESMVIHSLRRGESLSELVTGLVQRGCQDYIIHAKPGPRTDVG